VRHSEQGAEKFAKDGENDSTAVVTALVLNPLQQHSALNSGNCCQGDIRNDGQPVPEGGVLYCRPLRAAIMTDRLFLKVACCTAGH